MVLVRVYLYEGQCIVPTWGELQLGFRVMADRDWALPVRDDHVRVTVHHHSSGILYPWTGSGKMVHTGTYRYKTVQHGTCQYEDSSYVQHQQTGDYLA